MSKSTAKDKRYYAKVAQLGCIVCRNLGYDDTPPEIHHIGNGTMAKRASNHEVIPLCSFITGLAGMVMLSIQAEKYGKSITVRSAIYLLKF